ncbi:MAG TPA: STAS domain-containing protein [Candidatus Limnocylindrales bacterium]|jgi:anti-anti-sigma factor
MDDRTFGARVESLAGHTSICMRGDLDSRAEATLSSAYEQVQGIAPPAVTLDFGSVGYINSTGIALVVRLLADARRDGRAVRAVGLSPHYREIFRITRLSDFMDIVEGDAA